MWDSEDWRAREERALLAEVYPLYMCGMCHHEYPSQMSSGQMCHHRESSGVSETGNLVQGLPR